MNKPTAILLSIFTAILIVGLFVVSYLQSLHTVTFAITQPGVSITVKQATGGKTLGTLTASGKLSLQKGTYVITPTGTNTATTPIDFSVDNKSMTIEVHPGYSQAYLDQTYSTQAPAIFATLKAAYPSVITGFKINPGKLYLDGDWFATTLAQDPPHPRETGDIYRVVMHLVNGTWQVTTTPAIVLSASDYPNVPTQILRNANNLTGF